MIGGDIRDSELFFIVPFFLRASSTAPQLHSMKDVPWVDVVWVFTLLPNHCHQIVLMRIGDGIVQLVVDGATNVVFGVIVILI